MTEFINCLNSTNNTNMTEIVEINNIDINQDIDSIYNYLLDEIFNIIHNNEEIILPNKDERITKPDVGFNEHKRTEWRNFKENLKQICKEEMCLSIKNNLYDNVKQETNKLFEEVEKIDCADKNIYKKINELLEIKTNQIINKKINKIFGKKENETIEQSEFDNLNYNSNEHINNLINQIYQKNYEYVFEFKYNVSNEPNVLNEKKEQIEQTEQTDKKEQTEQTDKKEQTMQTDKKEQTEQINKNNNISPIDKLVDEILTRREVEMLKYFEAEYKKPTSINKSNYFLIPGRYKDVLPNSIKKYIRLYSQCNICKSIKTVILKNHKMSIDYKSCSKCKSKSAIIKGSA